MFQKERSKNSTALQKNSAENISTEVHTNREGTLHKESRLFACESVKVVTPTGIEPISSP